jgi:hypothetical protein
MSAWVPVNSCPAHSHRPLTIQRSTAVDDDMRSRVFIPLASANRCFSFLFINAETNWRTQIC